VKSLSTTSKVFRWGRLHRFLLYRSASPLRATAGFTSFRSASAQTGCVIIPCFPRRICGLWAACQIFAGRQPAASASIGVQNHRLPFAAMLTLS
jgi:hypothetical protein